MRGGLGGCGRMSEFVPACRSDATGHGCSAPLARFSQDSNICSQNVTDGASYLLYLIHHVWLKVHVKSYPVNQDTLNASGRLLCRKQKSIMLLRCLRAVTKRSKIFLLNSRKP